MFKKMMVLVVGIVIAVSTVGIASTAGASTSPGNPSGLVIETASATLPPGTTVTPGAPTSPLYGHNYCQTHTVLSWTTEECVELVNATEIHIRAYLISGSVFPGHQNVVGGGYTINVPASSNVTYGTHAYSLFFKFGTTTYCNTLWKHNSTGGYRNMGSVCT